MRLAVYHNDKTKPEERGISIVICAHDELSNLKELIPLLLTQNYSLFEIIVIEDRCNDDTYDYLLKEVTLIPNLKMVRVETLPKDVNGKKFAITLGIKAAQYDNILLTDADCRPASPDWINEMAAGFKDGKEIVLGYSPYYRSKGFLNLFIRYETFYTAMQYLSFALAKLPYMGVGRNLAYKKALFLNNKGFNTHLRVMGGDDDLFVNENATGQNVSIVIHPNARVYSVPKKTWAEWITQKKRHLKVGKLYKFKFKFVLGLMAFSQLFFYILFILALFMSPWWEITLGLFFAKVLSAVVLYHSASRKLKEKLPILMLPILDLMYCVYFVCVGAMALFSKKNKWK